MFFSRNTWWNILLIIFLVYLLNYFVSATRIKIMDAAFVAQNRNKPPVGDGSSFAPWDFAEKSDCDPVLPFNLFSANSEQYAGFQLGERMGTSSCPRFSYNPGLKAGCDEYAKQMKTYDDCMIAYYLNVEINGKDR